MAKRSKIIAFCGVNNLGKTTQKDMFIRWLSSRNLSSFYLKYPLYDVAPTCPIITLFA